MKLVCKHHCKVHKYHCTCQGRGLTASTGTQSQVPPHKPTVWGYQNTHHHRAVCCTLRWQGQNSWQLWGWYIVSSATFLGVGAGCWEKPEEFGGQFSESEIYIIAGGIKTLYRKTLLRVGLVIIQTVTWRRRVGASWAFVLLRLLWWWERWRINMRGALHKFILGMKLKTFLEKTLLAVR